MKKACQGLILIGLFTLLACSPTPTPTPTLVPTATLTLTPAPTGTPTKTPLPAAFPTSATPAPAEAFTFVGSVAQIESDDDTVTGRATVTGLQTIIIRDLSLDTQCTAADIRLGFEGQFDTPAGILTELEARTYDKEILVLIIPLEVTRDKADAIAVFCVDTGEVLGWARFHQ